MTSPAWNPSVLREFDQQQVLRFHDELSEAEQRQLQGQLESIDFPRLDQLIARALGDRDHATDRLQLAPLENAFRLPQTSAEDAVWEQARSEGKRVLEAGQVGAILVAGGQGSRLGFPHPKGMFPIGPVTDRTLFQIFFEQLRALADRYGHRIPYFIMTSDATHAETLEFLEQHNWFEYAPEDMFLFRQGTLPAVDDQTGKLLLSEKGQLAMSPDGHGGLLRALHTAGLIDEMRSRGVEYLFYHQVDNPCVKMCDPAMLGLHIAAQAEISTKVVAKRDSSEKVGVLAQVNGRQGIIEYSDLPEELAAARDEAGRLLYWAGNIAIHLFNRSLLERLTGNETGLPVHIAHKKVPFVNDSGELIEPDTPNAFKFEHFIFDAIPLAEKAIVIETSRAEEFNPVKNAEGNDSPTSSRLALNEIGRAWLQEAGYPVGSDASVEISPLKALEPRDLVGQFPPDTSFSDPVVIAP